MSGDLARLRSGLTDEKGAESKGAGLAHGKHTTPTKGPSLWARLAAAKPIFKSLSSIFIFYLYFYLLSLLSLSSKTYPFHSSHSF